MPESRTDVDSLWTKARRPIPMGDRILRVNHAGEQGAICIYTGQLLAAHLTARSMRAELLAFREDERRHKRIFQYELMRRGRKRCRSYWLCAAGGFALGVMTGSLGRRAIAATTMAVEQVVLVHLERQMAELADKDVEAVAAIEAIVADEREHHDLSVESAGRYSVLSRILVAVVSFSTEAVIWLGMKL